MRARDRLAARLYLQEDAYPVTFGLRDPAVSTGDYADFADFLCVSYPAIATGFRHQTESLKSA